MPKVFAVNGISDFITAVFYFSSASLREDSFESTQFVLH